MMMTPNSIRLPLIIRNGLPYLEHYYSTERQMKEITREEFMTSKNTWVPTKLDNIEGASDLMISQFPPIPVDAIDSFYNNQGDIHATKSYLEVDPAVVNLEVDPTKDWRKLNGVYNRKLKETEEATAKTRRAQEKVREELEK